MLDINCPSFQGVREWRELEGFFFLFFPFLLDSGSTMILSDNINPISSLECIPIRW
jgi:hypothetical protein